jgi:hypothetical protein
LIAAPSHASGILQSERKSAGGNQVKRAATLLGIAATVLSLNATTQDFMPRIVSSYMTPEALLSIPVVALPQMDSQAPDGSIAWLLAAGFLAIVVLRRTRSGPM